MRPYVPFTVLCLLSSCGSEWDPPSIDTTEQASFLPQEYYQRGTQSPMAPKEELVGLWSKALANSLEEAETERLCTLIRTYLPAMRGYFSRLEWAVKFVDEAGCFELELEGPEDVPLHCRLALDDPEFFPTDEIDGYLGTGDEVAFRLAAGRVIVSVFVTDTRFAADYPARAIVRQFDLDGLAEL